MKTLFWLSLSILLLIWLVNSHANNVRQAAALQEAQQAAQATPAPVSSTCWNYGSYSTCTSN